MQRNPIALVQTNDRIQIRSMCFLCVFLTGRPLQGPLDFKGWVALAQNNGKIRVKIRVPEMECTQQKCALEMTQEWSFLLSLGKKWPKKFKSARCFSVTSIVPL